MKIEIDKDADAAYVYLDETLTREKSAKTIEVNSNIILDFAGNGKLLGIEVLNASKTFSDSIIKSAVFI